MTQDFLVELKYLAIVSRLKRLSENTLADGRKLYRQIDIGIEPNWFLVFKIILEKGESSISEIASILQFAHTSVIAIVKKMEDAGYLNISKHPVDGRKQIIRLAKKAIDQMPEMQKVWEASESVVASIFPNDRFLEELLKLEKALEEKSFDHRVLRYLSHHELEILPYCDQDRKYFAELNEEWLKAYFSIEPIDVIVLKNPVEQILDKDGYILMAKVLKNVVGTVALLPINEQEIELCRMAVNPEYRGGGIGKKLLLKAIEKAKNACYTSVILYSSTKLKPAINLYRTHGFKEIPMETDVHYERANIKMILNLKK